MFSIRCHRVSKRYFRKQPFEMEVDMANELQGRKVAILLAPAGTEQVEFTEPKKAVEDERHGRLYGRAR